jgi:deoxycytidylate deaminase
MSCAKALSRSGIRKIVTAKPDYDDPKWGEQFRMSHELLTKTGVDVVFIS